MSRTALKWLPAVVVPAVVIAGIIAIPAQAGVAATLPEKSAQQLLELAGSSVNVAYAGTVVAAADLGLPSLNLSGSGMSRSSVHSARDAAAGSGSAAAASALGILSGTTTAKIFADGPQNLRVQLKDSLAERNLISDGTDLWAYDSRTNAATHVAVPAGVGAEERARVAAGASSLGLTSPAQLAQRFLSEIAPSTTVTVGAAGTVAGRTVYELVLTPKTPGTLIKSVSVSLDSKTGLPLKVDVLSNGQKNPAFEVGFTSISYSAQSANLFRFSPPQGATVTQEALPTAPTHPQKPDAAKTPYLIGNGWDTIVAIPAAAIPAGIGVNPIVTQLSTTVAGGVVLHTALLNVFLTDDGRAFAGSVSVARLQAAALAK